MLFISVASIFLFVVFVLVHQRTGLLNSLKNNLSGSGLLWRLFMTFCILTTSVLLPVFFAVYLTLAILKELTKIFLKYKYGDKFGGLLENMDLAWSADFPSKAIVMSGLIVECKDEFEELHEKIKKTLEERFFSGKYPKLTSTKKSFLGYMFYLQNEVTLEDCLYRFKCQETLDESSMMNILSELASRSLPKNGAAFWDIFIADEPLVGSTKDTKMYLVVFRFHHSLCDGIGMHKILVGCFADEKEATLRNIEETPKTSLEIVNKYIDYFTTWCLMPLVSTLMIFRKKDNIFNKIKKSGDKVSYWGIEKERKHLEMIAKIRQNIPNVYFTDILLAAISRSFAKNVVEKHSVNTDFVTFTIINTPYLQKFPLIHRNKKDILKLNNEHISCNVVQTPTTYPNELCKETLNKIHKLNAIAKKSMDSKNGYWIYRIVEVFFQYFTYKIPILVTDSQVVLSNLPTNIEHVEVFGGCRLVEYSIFTPNYTSLLVSVCINSYDGRLQFTVIADKCVIDNVDHAKKFVDDIYQYLDELEEELGLSK